MSLRPCRAKDKPVCFNFSLAMMYAGKGERRIAASIRKPERLAALSVRWKFSVYENSPACAGVNSYV